MSIGPIEHVSAIRAIHKILDGVEWDAETIELVAEVISSLEGYDLRSLGGCRSQLTGN